MVDLIAIAVIVVGLAFLFFGAAFSSWGVSALGLVVGGGAGYLLAPSIAGVIGVPAMGATVVAVLIGAAIGVILGYVLLSMAVGAIAFVLGVYVGYSALAGLLVDGGIIVEVVVAIAIGLVLGAIATVMTKTMMVVLTAFFGATLASQSITVDSLQSAHANVTLDPLLVDVTAPLFLGLFVLGLLTQFGLFKFGYVTRLLNVLPGSRPLRNKSRSD